ncbi:MAG: hypothetical protein MJZ32_12030 [Bacteroidaceae bacterium]|nr:hypothetical protein [Bacteroidaceae bacterium]
MKTKIVYVVASHDDDIYMEQAIVSAWSARYYNSDCSIEMVCDQDTFATLRSGIRAQYKSLFDQIHVREFQPEQSMMERSRWMKTTLREIIEGDFLYLDTDTVVCEDLSYVDDFKFDLGMVLDCNCEFRKTLVCDWVIPTMKNMYDIDVSNETLYFNSGVAFVRDCQLTRDFYILWNELWVHSIRHFNKLKDQQPLMKANIDMGYVVTEMSGDLNCQVAESIQHLHTAHIIHFFNNLVGKSEDLSPLFKELFVQVKQSGMTDKLKTTILNCKSSFVSPSMPVPYEGAMLWRHHVSSGKFDERIKQSNSYYLICFIYQRFPMLMRIMENFLGMLIRINNKRKRKFGKK